MDNKRSFVRAASEFLLDGLVKKDAVDVVAVDGSSSECAVSVPRSKVEFDNSKALDCCIFFHFSVNRKK